MKLMWKRWLSVLVATCIGSSWGMASAMQTPKQVNIDAYTFTPLMVHTVKEKGTLLLSDSPEYVTEPGVLAAGTLDGESRIYFYHVNEAEGDKKIGITLENRGTKEALVEVQRELYVDPSADYFKVGRNLSKLELEQSSLKVSRWAREGYPVQVNSKVLKKQLQQEAVQDKKRAKAQEKVRKSWLSAQKKDHTIHLLDADQAKELRFLLAPGERRAIFPALNDVPVRKDQLFSGIVDFQTTAPVYASVAMIDRSSHPVYAIQTLPVHPIDDVELRGTYVGSQRLHLVEPNFRSEQEAAAFEIANDREDAFITGVDETSDNRAVKNKGNYGVTNLYILHTEGTKPFALYFNPLGGAFSGSFRVTTSKGSQVYHIPKGGTYLGHETIYDTQLLDVYEPGEDIIIEYMSPGASNLPVRFLLIPQGNHQEENVKSPYESELISRILGKTE